MPRNVKLGRNPFAVSVGTADGLFLSSNLRRWALLINAPVPPLPPTPLAFYVEKNVLAAAAATDTTGVKASYTVPAGKTALVTRATFFPISGAPTVRLQIVQGANTIVLDQVTAAVLEASGFTLQAADVIRWNVTTAGVAGSTGDFYIAVQESQASTAFTAPNRVSLAFGGPAILDQGVTVYPGQFPFVFAYEDFG